MKRIALIAALALALGACETKPIHAPPLAAPPAPVREQPKSAKPAAPPPKPATPPAPAAQGPLSGKLAGAYMDEQETLLRSRLSGDGVRVARLGDDIVVSISDDALFQDNDISWRARDVLASIASALQQFDRTNVQVNSYTDTAGSSEANLRVSQVRADLIAGVLVRDGVAADRIAAKGYGETHLKVPTGDSVNEPRNRRVEIRIVPHRAS